MKPNENGIYLSAENIALQAKSIECYQSSVINSYGKIISLSRDKAESSGLFMRNPKLKLGRPMLSFHKESIVDEKENYKKEIKGKDLFPPIIVNLYYAYWDEANKEIQFHFKMDKYARGLLTDDELKYFKKNGDSVTIFIHGFNIGYGAFSPIVERIASYNEIAPNVFGPHMSKTKVADFSKVESTIFQDKKNLIAQSNFYHAEDSQAKDRIDDINGWGMHEWLVHIEYQLNLAAGWNGDLNNFNRCLFIAWPGKPDKPTDYMEAVHTSKKMGPMLACIIRQLKAYSPTMQVNIIAHSQGNGVMMSALAYLVNNHSDIKVDNALFWQAALPATVFSSNRLYKDDFWYLPNAHNAAKKLMVFYSKNDNVVGPMIEESAQPPGVSEIDVLKRKPDFELLAAIFTKILGVGSLYEAAMQIGVPISQLLSEVGLEKAWRHWRRQYKSIQKDKFGFIYQSKLVNQVHLYKQKKLLKKQLAEIKHRLNKNREKYQAYLNYLKSSLTYIEADLAMTLLRYPESMAALISGLSSVLLSNKESIYSLYWGAYRFSKFERQYQTYLDKVLTFLCATIFLLA